MRPPLPGWIPRAAWWWTTLGDIFIADTGNHRIRQVTPDGIIHNIAGTGAAGFAGDGGPAAAALLNGSARAVPGWRRRPLLRRYRQQSDTPPGAGTVAPPAPVIQPAAVTVVNAFSLREGAVAPGEIAAIFGAGLGPETGVTGALGCGWRPRRDAGRCRGAIRRHAGAAFLRAERSGQRTGSIRGRGQRDGDGGSALSGETGGSVRV